MIYWDFLRDKEINAFDVTSEAKVIWSLGGDPCIVDKEYVIIANQGVKLKQFDLQIESIQDRLETGHCLDGILHNWIFLNDFISIPFSYMTFVMQN